MGLEPAADSERRGVSTNGSQRGPLTDNVVFYDTEFSSLNPYVGELISVGIVKMNGEELYVEIEYDGPYDAFTVEHVVPHLRGPQVTREEAKERIRAFLGDAKPHMVCYVDCYDAIYTYKLFGNTEEGSPDVPFHWRPIDFASMLFAAGLDTSPELLAPTLGIDTSAYTQHNALDDARLLRDVYRKYFDYQ